MGGLLLLLVHARVASAARPPWRSLRFDPPGISLAGPGFSQRFLVTAMDAAGHKADVTILCRITSSDPEVVQIDQERGLVTGESAGRTQIRVRLGSLYAGSEISVGERPAQMTVNFARDIVSILTLKGCNGSACHGSPAGQNGFKLSLFGYDMQADYEMIVNKHDGRRVDLESPEQSLLLRKPAFQVVHGGAVCCRSIRKSTKPCSTGWSRARLTRARGCGSSPSRCIPMSASWWEPALSRAWS